jgi:hypothetical protein
MKTACSIASAALLLTLFAAPAARAVDEGQTHPKLSSGTLTSTATATDVVPLTNGAGNVKAFSCASTSDSVLAGSTVQIYVDGGAAQTLSFTNAMILQDNALNYYTGYIPMNVRFGSSIKVRMTRGSISAETWCSVSWALD